MVDAKFPFRVELPTWQQMSKMAIDNDVLNAMPNMACAAICQGGKAYVMTTNLQGKVMAETDLCIDIQKDKDTFAVVASNGAAISGPLMCYLVFKAKRGKELPAEAITAQTDINQGISFAIGDMYTCVNAKNDVPPLLFADSPRAEILERYRDHAPDTWLSISIRAVAVPGEVDTFITSSPILGYQTSYSNVVSRLTKSID